MAASPKFWDQRGFGSRISTRPWAAQARRPSLRMSIRTTAVDLVIEMTCASVAIDGKGGKIRSLSQLMEGFDAS